MDCQLFRGRTYHFAVGGPPPAPTGRPLCVKWMGQRIQTPRWHFPPIKPHVRPQFLLLCSRQPGGNPARPHPLGSRWQLPFISPPSPPHPSSPTWLPRPQPETAILSVPELLGGTRATLPGIPLVLANVTIPLPSFCQLWDSTSLLHELVCNRQEKTNCSCSVLIQFHTLLSLWMSQLEEVAWESSSSNSPNCRLVPG